MSAAPNRGVDAGAAPDALLANAKQLQCCKIVLEETVPRGRHTLHMQAIFTYEGTHQVNSLVSGRDITGVAAFRAPPARKRPVATSEGRH